MGQHRPVRGGDFEGATTPIDWNAEGDMTSGSMEIYGYGGGELATLEIQPFDLVQYRRR